MSQAEVKQAANEAFKRKDFIGAIGYYDDCISLLNALTPSPGDTQIESQKSVIYSNRSACYQQLAKGKESTDVGRDYLKRALEDAEASIAHDASFIKGYYRASAAAKQAKDMKRSARFLEAGLKMDPSNEALDNELASIQLNCPLRQIYGRVGGGRSLAVEGLFRNKPFKAWEAESSDNDESKGNDEHSGIKLNNFEIEDVANLVEIAVNTEFYENRGKGEFCDVPERAENVLKSLEIPGVSRLIIPNAHNYHFVNDWYNQIEVREYVGAKQNKMLSMFGKSGNEYGIFASLVLSDGLRASPVLIQCLRGDFAERSVASGHYSKLECSYSLRDITANMLFALQAGSPNPIPSLQDAYLNVLHTATERHKKECQRLNCTVACILLKYPPFKDDPRSLCGVRRAFMRDLIDLGWLGTWKAFLNEHGFPCSASVDVELEARTQIIQESRRQWERRLLGKTGWGVQMGMDNYVDSSNPKCTYKWCDNMQTPDDEFGIVCGACHEAHYCSSTCAYLDSGFHGSVCEPKPLPKKSAAAAMTSSMDQRKGSQGKSVIQCENCLIVSSGQEDFPVCEGCGKARFCSLLCSQYAMQKGSHRKVCPGADKFRRLICYYDKVDHDDLEHPAKCILCQKRFNFHEDGTAMPTPENIVVVGPCTYKGRPHLLYPSLSLP